MQRNTSASVHIKKENIASCLILEDHLKTMLHKTNIAAYKNKKNKFAPKYPHSSFGDFTKELFIAKKIPLNQRTPDYEESLSTTVISKHLFFLNLFCFILKKQLKTKCC